MLNFEINVEGDNNFTGNGLWYAVLYIYKYLDFGFKSVKLNDLLLWKFYLILKYYFIIEDKFIKWVDYCDYIRNNLFYNDKNL